MKTATALALVALATSLGGCKSFVQAFDFSRHSSAPPYAIGEADLEEGKTHLRAGRVGSALSPLHRAALNPGTSGEALNALGVAYAKLGRADLAERFFIAATKVDTDNERFAANLVRFYRSDLANDARLLFAQRENARQQYAAFTQSADAIAAAPATDERLVTSDGQTRRITIASGSTSQRVSVGRGTTKSAEEGIKAPPVRVTASDSAAIQSAVQGRPAEIGVSTRQTPAPARVRVGSTSTPASYPIRVTLPARGETSDQ